MSIHEVLLIGKSHGRIFGRLSETEIVKRYVRAMSDELDNSMVRHRIGETPRPWEFAVSLGLGWTLTQKEPLANRSRIWISDARVSQIGSLLAETLSHWGKTYIGLEHRSCKPVAKQETLAHIYIEPFQLNGLKTDIYACRLEELGRDLGREIANYMLKEKSGGFMKVTTAADLPQARGVRQIY